MSSDQTRKTFCMFVSLLKASETSKVISGDGDQWRIQHRA